MSGTQGDETGRRRTRLSPEAREHEIVRAAIGFFAENGFGGQTRELARAMGVSQALIFRYFPTKEDLIERVYEEVFSKEWRPNLSLVADRSQPLETRLIAFYRDYAGLILGHDYTRLLMFSALGGVNYHERLFARIAAEIYPVVIDELRAHYGRPSLAERPASQNEVEAVWGLHAAIFFVGIREHVFGLGVPPADGMVELKVRTFLQGVAAALAE
ncbi:MAG: TetR family transcriptional regulator [Phenylobacterium sp.]|uniref:TetR/AcrR family transcriptional regulator n=1 Tax=Phenylobacterium sp. TaxID=1871053 RepID=UPI0025D9BA7D|nr:TetR/AcrR family transcriptional regulator [Phenylobacterium sp.]MBA4011054.1 TetR family transcriptional regulator [Phenylobacterium sp.]